METPNNELAKITDHLEDKNYWFIRTETGTLYDDFISGSFVAFGYNEITYEEVDKYWKTETYSSALSRKLDNIIATQKDGSANVLSEKAANRRKTSILNQLTSFIFKMVEGDIVVIPSKSGNFLAFGQVIDDTTYIPADNDYPGRNLECPFIKRRKVKWIVRRKAADIDAKLITHLRTPSAISSMNDLGPLINREISSLYVAENNLHLVLRVESQEDISISTYNFLIVANKLTRILANKLEAPNIGDIKLKANVQSPGLFEFFSLDHDSINLFLSIVSFIKLGQVGTYWTNPRMARAIGEIANENGEDIEEARKNAHEFKLTLDPKLVEAAMDNR